MASDGLAIVGKIKANDYRSSTRGYIKLGEGNDITSPIEADLSYGTLRIATEAANIDEMTVSIIAGNVYEDAELRYYQLGNEENIIGRMTRGDAVFNIPEGVVKSILKHGVCVFPTVEFLDVNGDHTTYILDNTRATYIEYTLINPASRGRVNGFVPGQYSSISADEDITVKYTYHQDFGGYAQGYLGVKAVNVDTGETVTIARKKAVSVEDGAEGSFVIPAGTLSGGKWEITVSAAPSASANYYGTSDEFWETGETLTYTVRENPATSSVSCDGRPIPQVSWESVSQAAYQVRFGDYDSGARAGTETAFVVSRIFADGAYPAQVRTASSAGTWSDWTETEYVTIQNVEPSGTFTATAVQDGNNIRLNWTAFSGAAHYAVFRDGVMIAVTDANAAQYVDRIGAGGEYEVLAVTSERYYKSSGLLRLRLRLAADLISADGGYTWIACRLTPDRKSQPEDIREDMTFVYYAGSEKPAAFRSGQRERVKSFSYIFFSREPARRIRELLGREIIVKTTRGEHIRGTVADISWGDAKQPVVSFQVREVRGEEDGREYPA